MRHGNHSSGDDHLQVFAVKLGTHLGELRIIPKRDPLLEMTYKTGRRPHQTNWYARSGKETSG